MLYFLNSFTDGGDFFNLFRYITFRAGGAFFIALFLAFLVSHYQVFKKCAREWAANRDLLPEGHLKAGTPTMGGVLILIPLMVSSVFG